MLNNSVKFFLENKLVAWIFPGVFVMAPFNFEWLPVNPVAVRNPYFGDQMLTCGSTLETIEK